MSSWRITDEGLSALVGGKLETEKTDPSNPDSHKFLLSYDSMRINLNPHKSESGAIGFTIDLMWKQQPIMSLDLSQYAMYENNTMTIQELMGKVAIEITP